MTAAPPQPARAEFTDIRLVAAAGEAARAERYEMLSKSTTCGAVSLPSPALHTCYVARENAWYLRPANQRAASKHTASAHRPAAQLCVSAQGRAWHLSPANTSHTFTRDPLALALMMHAKLTVMWRWWCCSPAWTLQEYDICPRLVLGPELLELHHSQGVQAQGLGAGRMADMCPGRGSFWSLVSVHTGDQV